VAVKEEWEERGEQVVEAAKSVTAVQAGEEEEEEGTHEVVMLAGEGEKMTALAAVIVAGVTMSVSRTNLVRMVHLDPLHPASVQIFAQY
jgi:exosome complex RNA-binding protein Csl4